jgi:hypothetical protein
MVSAIEVYTTLKNLANKEQKGFITPDVFNSFASVAQRNIINEMFDELEGNKRKAQGGQDLPRRRSSYQSLKEDVGRYIKSSSVSISDGAGDIPADCRKIINIKSDTTVVDLVYDVDTMDYINSSTLSAPTSAFPAALITSTIEVSPTSITSVNVVYYKNPAVNPQIVTAPGNTFDLSSTVDFDLPEDYASEVVYEIAKLLGVRLRDQNIQVFGAQEAQQQ